MSLAVPRHPPPQTQDNFGLTRALAHSRSVSPPFSRSAFSRRAPICLSQRLSFFTGESRSYLPSRAVKFPDPRSPRTFPTSSLQATLILDPFLCFFFFSFFFFCFFFADLGSLTNQLLSSEHLPNAPYNPLAAFATPPSTRDFHHTHLSVWTTRRFLFLPKSETSLPHFPFVPAPHRPVTRPPPTPAPRKHSHETRPSEGCF